MCTVAKGSATWHFVLNVASWDLLIADHHLIGHFTMNSPKNMACCCISIENELRDREEHSVRLRLNEQEVLVENRG